jgi:hypothetical protein
MYSNRLRSGNLFVQGVSLLITNQPAETMQEGYRLPLLAILQILVLPHGGGHISRLCSMKMRNGLNVLKP